MSETLIDYDKTNKYLPESLRQFVGATDRVVVQDFEVFLPMYQGVERLAVFNNRTAAEFASGFTKLNYVYLRSGVAPRLLDVVVSKAVGRVWYQAEEENEVSFNDYLDSNYFSDALYKASEETAMTGRSIMVLYESDDETLEIASYNLFRHRLIYDKKKNVAEAWIYIVSMNVDASIKQVITEHRFYKNEKDEQGKKVKVPYQEFLVYDVRIDKTDSSKSTSTIIPNEKLSKEIKAAYPNITFNRPKKMNLPSIGVYDLRYTKVNKKFFDTDIPEAMFTDAVDNAVTIDTSITGKEVEKENGRGQVLLPDFDQGFNINEYISQEAAGGRLMRSLSVTFKDPTFKKYPTRSMEDSKPQNVQFDIRSSEWVNEIDNDTARLCENVGVGLLDYCPRLLGGQQRTDDEINAMTDITANTVKNFRNLNQGKINQLLTDVAIYHKLNIHVSIRWDMAAILNPTKNTQLIKEQLSAGLISRKEAIRRANPDLTPNEVEQLYKEVTAEIGAMATENAFNNF